MFFIIEYDKNYIKKIIDMHLLKYLIINNISIIKRYIIDFLPLDIIVIVFIINYI